MSAAASGGRVTPRRRAREFVLQGLYQRQLAGNSPAAIRAQIVEASGFAKADQPYFDEMWNGVCEAYDDLIAACAPYLDRRPAELSPVERAILAIGAWELKHRAEVPYRVAINESVELAKAYGGTDGHRYVNAVLDKLAAEVRGAEIAARAAERASGEADAA
jgi:N utilization substance protein B